MNEEVQNPRLMKFPQDSVILREGEMCLDMYKIIQGHAELYTDYGTEQEVLLGIIGPQQCFGEFGLLLQKPAIYTVVAFEDVYAMRVTEGEMGNFVQHNQKNVIDIMRNMARTMMIMQTQINLLSEEVRTGKAPDQEVLEQSKRNLRGYAVYKPSAYNMTGKFHYLKRS